MNDIMQSKLNEDVLNIQHIYVPPLKCQGIKTKLIPMIKSSVKWDYKGKWIEPFLGSGVVLFNINPKQAVISDKNTYIIEFYKNVQNSTITADIVRKHLELEGAKLLKSGESHYYEVRDRFNSTHNLLDFLFLNRSCFNGMMRFNSKGKFNVPFCRKPDRFRRSYITKIVNQVKNLSKLMYNKDWQFLTSDWKQTLSLAKPRDFVYLDPPYIGRHTDYYGVWTQHEAEDLAEVAKSLPSPFILSMWSENKYRTNTHLKNFWNEFESKKVKHFYHVGPTESLRNAMEEALVIGHYK